MEVKITAQEAEVASLFSELAITGKRNKIARAMMDDFYHGFMGIYYKQTEQEETNDTTE